MDSNGSGASIGLAPVGKVGFMMSQGSEEADSEPKFLRVAKRMLKRGQSSASVDTTGSAMTSHSSTKGFFKRLATQAFRGLGSENPSRSQMSEHEEELRHRISTLADRSTDIQTSIHTNLLDSGLSQRCVKNAAFQNATLFMIVLYAIWVSIDAEFNDAPTLATASPVFQVMENVFCAFFFVELLIRFCAFRATCHACRDFSFVFDAGLVFLTVMETWLLPLFVAATGTEDNVTMQNSSWLRLLRLFRLTRLARTARLVQAVPELVIMVKGVIAAMRSVLVTALLMIMLLYVLGVSLKQTAQGTEAGELYFSSVPQAMFTLFIYATLLDGPSVVLEVMDTTSSVLFILAILVTNLLLLNMLIGVMCEASTNVSSMEKQRLDETFMTTKVFQMLIESGVDLDGDGQVSKNELLTILDNEKAATFLQEAGVDVVGLLDIADLIFQSDTFGREFDKQLSFKEFMNVLLALRGANTATVKDIVDFKKVMNTHFTQLSNDLAQIYAMTQKGARSRSLSKPGSGIDSKRRDNASNHFQPEITDAIAGGQMRRIEMLKKSWTQSLTENKIESEATVTPVSSVSNQQALPHQIPEEADRSPCQKQDRPCTPSNAMNFDLQAIYACLARAEEHNAAARNELTLLRQQLPSFPPLAPTPDLGFGPVDDLQ
eukprot:gb/GFBE01063137.1/.p1 GENE.gb/GFBE01063137.1/~~gb/GFBE01063137.1/.p1  ORF type:complete len:660 (+),score=126.26 gb/GFBE01063137.1/:1-1980(+)